MTNYESVVPQVAGQQPQQETVGQPREEKVPWRVICGEPTADGSEFNVVLEADSREVLLDSNMLRVAIKVAAAAGFGLDCAISRAQPPYPVTEDGRPVTFPPITQQKIVYRRVITCAPRI